MFSLLDIVFVVASDNPDWARENIKLIDRQIVFTQDFMEQTKPKIDPIDFEFAVLSHCNHSVIDYGTFSFWTAYLAGGQVFLPKFYKGSQQVIDIVPQIEQAGLVGEGKRYHFVE